MKLKNYGKLNLFHFDMSFYFTDFANAAYWKALAKRTKLINYEQR